MNDICLKFTFDFKGIALDENVNEIVFEIRNSLAFKELMGRIRLQSSELPSVVTAFMFEE